MKPYILVGLIGVVLDAIGNVIWLAGWEREAGLHPLVGPVLFAIDVLLGMIVLVAGRFPRVAPLLLGILAVLFAPLAVLSLVADANPFDAPTFVVFLAAWLLALVGNRQAQVSVKGTHTKDEGNWVMVV
jgi:hypothetical protein